MKKCDKCEFAVLEDYGYSNYTVEGTYLHCAKKLHPESGFDRFYGEDDRLKFAEKCSGFCEGEPLALDVDGDDWPKEGEAKFQILKMWQDSK